MANKSVTILSGGMDSTTLAFMVAKTLKQDQIFISFNYGQRHVRELECAKHVAEILGCPHAIIDLSAVGPLLKGSALTDTVPMPEGYYAEENMRLTVVPNRNAIMLSIAWGIAIGEKAENVYYGAHAGDHFIYEDCRPVFVEALGHAFRLGTHGDLPFAIHAPFLDIDKIEILKIGYDLGVPYEHTWTCYKGGKEACGVCGSCQERLSAFASLGINDPLPYETRKLYAKGEQVSTPQ